MKKLKRIKKYLNEKNILVLFFIPILGISQMGFIEIPILFTYVEVAQNYIPNKLTYDVGLVFINKIGDGWRLPTKEELLKMYEKKDFEKNLNK